MSHSKLRPIIRTISGSKYPEKSLRKKLERDPDFQGFIDLMLTEMGYFKDGQFSAE